MVATLLTITGIGLVSYAGTAIGLAISLLGLGNLISPPLGNSLADVAPGLPFIFWATLAVVGFFGLYLVKEEKMMRY